MKLWYIRKEILIKKVFYLTHKETIEKIKEALRKPGGAITAIVDNVKLCASKYSIERSK